MYITKYARSVMSWVSSGKNGRSRACVITIRTAGKNSMPAGLDNIRLIFSLKAFDFSERMKTKKGIKITEYRNKYKINHR